MHSLWALLFTICLSTSSFAAMRDCKLPSESQSEASAISKVIKLGQKISDTVEAVSDDVAKYLKDETERSLQQKDSQKFLAVTKHRSYRAWQVRKTIAAANQWLELSQTVLGTNSAALRKSAGMYVLSAMDEVNVLMISLDLYVHFDRSQNRPHLNPSDDGLIKTTAYQAQNELIGILACLVQR